MIHMHAIVHMLVLETGDVFGTNFYVTDLPFAISLPSRYGATAAVSHSLRPSAVPA